MLVFLQLIASCLLLWIP